MIFASTIFLSAFLLFQIQPVIARYILPWYGGSPAVWSTCLLFFQVGLLLGYGYAHLLAEKAKPRTQVWVHLALLVILGAWSFALSFDTLPPISQPDRPRCQALVWGQPVWGDSSCWGGPSAYE